VKLRAKALDPPQPIVDAKSVNVLTAQSRGKINLTLHVRGRRPDGFHELESIVARIALADDLKIEAWDGPLITVDCSDPGIPVDASNLAVRAARLLQSWAAVGRGAHITLVKRIPAGAGLGGGSSNAATTLQLLDRMWHTGIERGELAEIAAMLGSDVPLFLSEGPLNIVRGRGELIDPVRPPLAADVLLALPPIHSPTAAVYGAFALAGQKFERPPVDVILRDSADPAARETRLDPKALMSLAFNDLEPAATTVTPALGEFAARLRSESGLPFCMSGSGSAFFCLFPPGAGQSAKQCERLTALFPTVRFVNTTLEPAK
jgi:4-diphosphocytidyl-2-C-methyl-D-erythritol kinase